MGARIEQLADKRMHASDMDSRIPSHPISPLLTPSHPFLYLSPYLNGVSVVHILVLHHLQVHSKSQSSDAVRRQNTHTITAHNHCTRPAAAKCFPRPSHRLTRYLELEVAYFLTMCSVTFTTSPDGVVGYVCKWMQREREGRGRGGGRE